MRTQTAFAALGVAVMLTGCTHVEWPAPTPAVVRAPPAVIATPAPGVAVLSTVTVRPAS